MNIQIPQSTKQSRVEELMLTQQKVAFARNKASIGQTLEVLVDRPAGRDTDDGYVARSAGQAPDIDSVVFVDGPGLHPGQIASVKVTAYQGYDLLAEIPKKKGKSLAVLSAGR